MQKQSGKREDSARTGTQEKGKAPEAKRVDLDLPEGDEEEDPTCRPEWPEELIKPICAHAATTSIYCVAAKAKFPKGARERAIQQMERQEKVLKSRPAASSR